MAYDDVMTKVHVSLLEDAEEGLQAFIDEVDGRLASDENTCTVVRDTPIDLFGDREAWERWQNGKPVSPATRIRLRGYDPCNATLEAEYHAEKDEAKFRRSEHLQWLWRQFDAMPMADNVAFALRFRQMLADHLFAEADDNLRIFRGVTFSYGHNISVGDNTVIHDGIHLDDRGKLAIGDRVSISDSVHIYSHSHDIVDQIEVGNYHTTIGDDARVTYDVMMNAGVSVGENAIVGAWSVVQGDVPAHHIAVGSPAKSVKVEPGFEEVAEPFDVGGERHADERETPYELPDDIEAFDEFDRDLDGPVDSHRRE